MPETEINGISVHLTECHEGDNDESSSELRASLSELPPNLTMLVGGRGFHQAASPHCTGDTEMRMQRGMSYERRPI